MTYSAVGSTNALLAMLLSAVVSAACSEGARDESGAAVASKESIVSHFGTGLSLEGFASESVVSTSDSIYIGYLIRNGGGAKRLVLDPRFFEVQIHATDRPSETLQQETWTGSTGDESIVTLPRYGMVGRVFTLACGDVGFSALGACGSPPRELSPGTYGVVIVYSPPEPPDSRSQRIRLVSDTVRVTVVER